MLYQGFLCVPAPQTNIRGVLSLMKANHPADCMNCDANGRLGLAERRCMLAPARAGSWHGGSHLI